MRETAQFGAEQESLDAAGIATELRIGEQHEPILREEGLDLGAACCGSIIAGRAGDAPAPWIGRLPHRIADRNVHHHQRIEGDRKATRLQVRDGRAHTVVRRRAAEGRCAIMRGHETRRRAREAGDGPRRQRHELRGTVDAWRNGAPARAQVIAEP